MNPAEEEAVPSFFMVKRVTPDAEAVRRSAPLILLTAREALEPMELLTKRGNSVAADVPPINTWESKSPVSTMFPDPLGVKVKSLLLPEVEMVVPESERLFVPKDAVPIPEMIWLLARSVPPSVKDPI